MQTIHASEKLLQGFKIPNAQLKSQSPDGNVHGVGRAMVKSRNHMQGMARLHVHNFAYSL